MRQHDYKAEFSVNVTELIERSITDRTERMAAVQELIDAYIDSVGKRPDGAELERLTDYILREELTDPHPDKVTRNEYPFMSDWQLDLRRDREYSLDLAENHGIDGKDYRQPTRRRRTAKEERFIDKVAQLKNKRRNAQYKQDTSPGKLETYNLRDNGGELTEPFVTCRGTGERWANELARVY